MLCYEVNLSVDAEIAGAYRAWLDEHIRAILKLDGFEGATLFERAKAEDAYHDPGDDGRLLLTVQYRLRDRASFEAYLKDHAPAFREDGLKRFGGRFSAKRRVLMELAEY
ncbi:MAG: DUF4286 family protein [Planctomycetota bacterium]|nr:DUF4286 family protein [Planctomycetota bacterium]